MPYSNEIIDFFMIENLSDVVCHAFAGIQTGV
jgi:hypothetical protein